MNPLVAVLVRLFFSLIVTYEVTLVTNANIGFAAGLSLYALLQGIDYGCRSIRTSIKGQCICNCHQESSKHCG
jgi:hypothetical protein